MPVGHYAYDATLTFPDKGWQITAFLVFAICLVVNSGVVARRMEQYKKTFTTFRPLDSTWLCDVMALIVFVFSFLFIFVNGILTFAIGTHLHSTCDASVTICVSAFVLSKVVLYLYYLERLLLTSWAKDSSNTAIPPFLARFRCRPWLFGIGIFVFGVPCAILLGFSRGFQVIFHNNALGPEAVGCHVFLKWYFATPIIVWAAIINTYILLAFVWPMRRGQLKGNNDLRRVCKSSIWSLLVSGLSTVINLSVLLILKGEHGIECLLCCSIDVMVNSLVLAIISDKRGELASFPSLAGKGHQQVVQDDENQSQLSSSSPRLAAKRIPFESRPSEVDDKEPHV